MDSKNRTKKNRLIAGGTAAGLGAVFGVIAFNIPTSATWINSVIIFFVVLLASYIGKFIFKKLEEKV